MVVRAFGRQSFLLCSHEQITISGHKSQGRQPCLEEALIGGKGSGQLHGIVSPQFVIILGQKYGVVQNNPVNRHELIFRFEMLCQQIYRSISFLAGDSSWGATTRSQSRSHLHQSDFGDCYRVACVEAGDFVNPTATCFSQIPLSQRAGIKKIVAHSFGPRISKISSLSGSPSD